MGYKKCAYRCSTTWGLSRPSKNSSTICLPQRGRPRLDRSRSNKRGLRSHIRDWKKEESAQYWVQCGKLKKDWMVEDLRRSAEYWALHRLDSSSTILCIGTQLSHWTVWRSYWIVYRLKAQGSRSDWGSKDPPDRSRHCRATPGADSDKQFGYWVLGDRLDWLCSA